MKCNYCGNELKETDSKCPFCGTPVGAATPVDGEVSEGGVSQPDTARTDGLSGAGGVSEPITPPSKKMSGGKIAAIAVAAAAVVGVGIFGATKLMEKDPKEVVIAAFENIYTEDQVKPMEELFGLSQFQENSMSSQETGMEIVLESCSEEEAASFEGGGIRVGSKYDQEAKNGSVNIGVLYNNMDLANLNVYYGDETLMMAIPELSGKVFTLDMSEGLAQRIADSPLLGPALQYSDVDLEGLETFYHEYIDWVQEKVEDGTASDPYGIADVWNRYKEGCQAQENFKAALTVEKAEKASFRIDGEEVSCKGYQVHVSKDSMISFLRTSSDFFLQDEEMKQNFLDNMKMSLRILELTGTDMEMSPFDGMSAEDQLEENYEEMKKSVNEAIDELDKALNDVDMLVHVDKKGRLASVNGTTSLTVDNGTVDVNFDLQLQGGSYLTQNALAKAELTEDGETVTFEMTKQGTYDGKQLTGDIAFDVTGKDLDVSLGMGGTYNSDGGDFTLRTEAISDGDKVVSLSAAGVVSELEKGTVLHMDFDEIRVEMPGTALLSSDSDKDFFLVFGGEYDLRPLTGSISQPDGEKMDIVAATEEDWQSVMMEVYMGAMDMANKLGSAMN